MALIATHRKPYAFAEARAAVARGEEGFIRSLIVLAVSFREMEAHLRAKQAGQAERKAPVVRLVAGGQHEGEEG